MLTSFLWGLLMNLPNMLLNGISFGEYIINFFLVILRVIFGSGFSSGIFA